jgi:hypothetical protein
MTVKIIMPEKKPRREGLGWFATCVVAVVNIALFFLGAVLLTMALRMW